MLLFAFSSWVHQPERSRELCVFLSAVHQSAGLARALFMFSSLAAVEEISCLISPLQMPQTND